MYSTIARPSVWARLPVFNITHQTVDFGQPPPIEMGETPQEEDHIYEPVSPPKISDTGFLLVDFD